MGNPNGGISKEKVDLVQKSQDLVVGWAHTKEYKKKYYYLAENIKHFNLKYFSDRL